MSLVSLLFLCFVFAVALLYFLLPKKLQPVILLAGSLLFYALMDVRQVIYLGALILITYLFALLMGKHPGAKRLLLTLALLFTLGALFVVKFVPYLWGLLPRFGLFPNAGTLSLLVPVGVSFYTLQAASYLIDVSRGTVEPDRNFLRVSLFLSYFPLILQGPIARYATLAPQLTAQHRFSYTRAKFGLQLMLWGYFKKLVIADRCGVFVNAVFAEVPSAGKGLLVVGGILFFTLQLYTDFSGCVDICRGVSALLGIDMDENFNHPYFAVSVSDFWRRWHMSLSSWLRDYVYIPLGGNRRGTLCKYRNILIVFAVSGLWHGTGLQYLVWGMLHGFYQVFGAVTAGLRRRIYGALHLSETSRPAVLWKRLITFLLVSFAWLFFRTGVSQAFSMLHALLFDSTTAIFQDGTLLAYGLTKIDFLIVAVSTLLLWCVSYLQTKCTLREKIDRFPLPLRWGLTLLLIAVILIFGQYGPGYDAASFLYMQF